MLTIRVHQPGGPDAMWLDELEMPRPGPGEVLVRVEAAGVNFIDIYHRTGLYPLPLPATLGLEGAGIIESCGPGVSETHPELAPGTHVAWSTVAGSYASHLIAPADRLVPVPKALGSTDAAAVMLQGMTAHYLVKSTYPLGPGDTCLVHAAAGGVGLLLCQMAKAAGARVIGTTSTPAKAEAARAAGADEVILYTQQEFAGEIRKLTQGAGIQVVYDSVGQSTFQGSLECLAPRGMLVLYGQASGPVPPVDLQILAQKGSLFVTRPSLFHYVATREELLARAADVLSWLAQGELALTIDRTLPLAEAARAHTLLESRQTSGKLVLIP